MADLSRYRSSTTTTTKSKKKKTKPKGFNVLSSSSDEDEHQQTIARNQQKEKVPVLEKQPKFTPVSKDVSSEGEDQSPPRRARRESSEETSPRKRRRGSEDLSPPRRQRNEEPIRQQEEKHDLSPPRRRLRSPTKSDASPRKRSRGDTSSKARQDEDLSPPRRKRERSDSPEVRRRPNIDTDLSPPRRKSSYSTVDHAKLSQGNAATIHRDQFGKTALYQPRAATQARLQVERYMQGQRQLKSWPNSKRRPQLLELNESGLWEKKLAIVCATESLFPNTLQDWPTIKS